MNSENDPVKRAQELARRPLPKRFYKSVSVREADGGFEIYLDERTLKTPGRKPLRLSSADVMHLIAEEWNAQAEQVDPATMPVTRLANTALDGVEAVRDAVAQEIASYACSDLVCYRAEGPEALVRAQEDAWNDLVAWFARAHGMALKLAAGVMPVQQDTSAAQAVAARLAPRDALDLAALHTLTTLSGSAVIALAFDAGELSLDEAWTAAHIDEDWQIRQWGEDAEAMARRAARKREFDAAASVLQANAKGR